MKLFFFSYAVFDFSNILVKLGNKPLMAFPINNRES